LLRWFILHPKASETWSSLASGRQVIDQVIGLGLQPSEPVANQMLATRVLTNLFNSVSFRDSLSAQFEQILSALAECSQSCSTNAAFLLSAASLLLNFSVLFLRFPKDKLQCLSIFAEIFPSTKDNSSLVRSLQALKNLTWKDQETKTLIADLDILPHIQSHTKSDDPVVQKLASDIIRMSNP